jgi:alpha-tubulin suppressor-like RCC1 family protein
VETATNIRSVHAMDDISLAITEDGVMHAWGDNVFGTPDKPVARPLPSRVTGMFNVKDVVYTLKHGYMVLFENGTLVNYTTADGDPLPSEPIIAHGVKQISASLRADPKFFLVLFYNGSISAWGRDIDGQASGPMATVHTGVDVAAGTDSVVLLSNGTVTGFGTNNFAQLTTKHMPAVVDVAHGESFVVALLADGSIRAWGKLREVVTPPELGVPRADSPLFNGGGPLLYGLVSSQHVLALTADRRVVAWGPDFGTGELNVPALNASDPVQAMATGYNHSLLLLTSGRVVSFGLLKDEDVPEAARSAVTQVAAGWGFSVALRGDGRVVVWGDASRMAECSLADVPADAANGSVVVVSAGAWHVLALLRDGSVRAWGCNQANQVVVPAGLQATPSTASDKVRVVSVAAGAYHSVVLLSNGSVIGWGSSNNRQLNRVMATYDDVAIIAAGLNTTAMYRTSSNAIWYWGPETTEYPDSPPELVAESVIPLPQGARVTALTTNRRFTAALMQVGPAPHSASDQQQDDPGERWRAGACLLPAVAVSSHDCWHAS